MPSAPHSAGGALGLVLAVPQGCLWHLWAPRMSPSAPWLVCQERGVVLRVCGHCWSGFSEGNPLHQAGNPQQGRSAQQPVAEAQQCSEPCCPSSAAGAGSPWSGRRDVCTGNVSACCVRPLHTAWEQSGPLPAGMGLSGALTALVTAVAALNTSMGQTSVLPSATHHAHFEINTGLIN